MKTESATLMFGMVSIPVKVTGLVKSSGEVRFRNLHAACSTPVQSKAWCPTCNVEADVVVKGVKINSKQYAPIPDVQVDAAKVERSNVVTITKFVSDDSIEPEQFYKHYHLIPDEKITDGYFLLTEGLIRKDMVGVGSMAIWGKEHPCIVRQHEGGLVLTLLNVAEDMVARPYDPPELVTTKAAHKSMLDLACDLIERQAGTLTPDDLTSASREKREELVESILNKVETPAPSLDLLSALRMSIGRKKAVK